MATPIPQVFVELDSDLLDIAHVFQDKRYRVPAPIENQAIDLIAKALKKIRDTAAESCGIDTMTGLSLGKKAEAEAAALANSPFARRTTSPSAVPPAVAAPALIAAALAPEIPPAAPAPAAPAHVPAPAPEAVERATAALAGASESPTTVATGSTTAELMGAAGIPRSSRNDPVKPNQARAGR